MKPHMALLMGSLVLFFSCTQLQESVKVMDRPDPGLGNIHYVGNRAPLSPTPFIRLPPGAIEPKGWIGKQLELQAKGFIGRLIEISRFLAKEGNAWLNPDTGKHGWEEPVYWLKGYGITAYILKDQGMMDEARIWIEGILNSQKPDGWFGPDKGRKGAATRLTGREDLWPNMIALFCLQDYYELTGDERVIRLMTRYMKYLESLPEDRFLIGYWPKMRGADQLYSIYWLYNRTGDKFLLDLAHKTFRQTARWDEDVINWHNVNMAQGFGGPGTYFMQSKDPKHLEACERNWRKMRKLYGQVPGGMFGGDENCRKGFAGPRQAVETCGMVEMMLSHETLFQITGDPVWADRCEDVAFNSLPASTTWDMKALRYLTAPNMVLSDRHSKSPGLQNGGPMLLMNPHIHRCCQHNMGHGWPYYVQNLWLAAPGNGLCAAMYGASEVKARVGEGQEVHIKETTHYPFDNRIEFEILSKEKAAFPLYLRIPGWCETLQLKINNKLRDVKTKPLSYLRIFRQWKQGDRVSLVLGMSVSLRRWKENFNSVSVDRGPLTYSLLIREKLVRQGGDEIWPAWEILPASHWNYGLAPESGFEVILGTWPSNDVPFTLENTPIKIRTKGRKIPQWVVDERYGLVGEIQQSPAFTRSPLETLTLVPMGAARLRISSFPTVSTEPGAVTWSLPPEKMASNVFYSDTVDALWDGKIPEHSNDQSIPRFTWWDRKGSVEWVQYNLKETDRVSWVEVYWFDDTGVGGCRTPKSWRLLYKEGDAWKPVQGPSPYGVLKDQFNRVTFEPIIASALRIEVKLQPDYSSGVLEMRAGH